MEMTLLMRLQTGCQQVSYMEELLICPCEAVFLTPWLDRHNLLNQDMKCPLNTELLHKSCLVCFKRTRDCFLGQAAFVGTPVLTVWMQNYSQSQKISHDFVMERVFKTGEKFNHLPRWFQGQSDFKNIDPLRTIVHVVVLWCFLLLQTLWRW